MRFSTATAWTSADAGGAPEAREPPFPFPVSTKDLGADHKGEFMLAARRYCYPLTITDFQPLPVRLRGELIMLTVQDGPNQRGGDDRQFVLGLAGAAAPRSAIISHDPL